MSELGGLCLERGLCPGCPGVLCPGVSLSTGVSVRTACVCVCEGEGVFVCWGLCLEDFSPFVWSSFESNHYLFSQSFLNWVFISILFFYLGKA